MGCSDCRKQDKIKLNGVNTLKDKLNARERAFFFEGKVGKFFYFFLLLILALTPIVNIFSIYAFYIAVYGGKIAVKKTTNE